MVVLSPCNVLLLEVFYSLLHLSLVFILTYYDEIYKLFHNGTAKSWHIPQAVLKIDVKAWRYLTWEFYTVLQIERAVFVLGYNFPANTLIIFYIKYKNVKSYEYCLYQLKNEGHMTKSSKSNSV
jgi:hypothetical protein